MTISMQWNETMVVHVGEMDEQHEKLVSIMNSLYEALQSGKAGEAEKEVLVELIKYTDYHFSMEKGLMEKYDYPEMDDHLERHGEFTEKLKELCKKHQIENAEVSRDILAFLIGWIINHIMEADKKLGDFLNGKGVK